MAPALAIGARRGKLVLLEYVEKPQFITSREAWALWRCDCGNEKKIRVRSVAGGHTRSCGCAFQSGTRAWMRAYRTSNEKRRP